jgi:hypothetical protein
MSVELEKSAVEFTRLWCNLFVGHKPQISQAMECFASNASILIPNIPYRLGPEEDNEEINFSHLVDGRGEVHFWQVLEPKAFVIGDVAVVSYYARYNVGLKGESTIKCAKETLVLARQDESWQIVHMHNSLVS